MTLHANDMRFAHERLGHTETPCDRCEGAILESENRYEASNGDIICDECENKSDAAQLPPRPQTFTQQRMTSVEESLILRALLHYKSYLKTLPPAPIQPGHCSIDTEIDNINKIYERVLVSYDTTMPTLEDASEQLNRDDLGFLHNIDEK